MTKTFRRDDEQFDTQQNIVSLNHFNENDVWFFILLLYDIYFGGLIMESKRKKNLC